MYCRGARVLGEFRLLNATIDGYLGITGTTLVHSDQTAFAGDNLTVNGNMILDGKSSVEGEFRLINAHITGQLALGEAEISNQAGIAINCDYVTVGGSLSCTGGLRVRGTTDLVGASIKGELELSGGIFCNPGRIALRADRVAVQGPMACSDAFKAIGEIRLLGAHIDGQLLLNGGQVINEDGFALNADGLTVDGDMLCQDGFLCKGQIRLGHARISGQLGFCGATLVQPTGLALNCQSAQIGSLWLSDVIISGGVELTDAYVKTLVDRDTTWPQWVETNLLVYDNLYPERPIKGPSGRLAWLAKSRTYRPQPYEQLAAYCRRLGHDKDARYVLLTKNRKHRACLPRKRRMVGWLWDVTVGYGYRPWLAVAWLGFIAAASTIYFWRYHPVPVNPAHHPHYQAFLYVADLMLPVVNLGQSGAWNATGFGQWLAAGLSIVGWAFAIAIVAGVTRTLVRD